MSVKMLESPRSTSLGLLIRISRLIIFAESDLALLLGHDMLDPYFFRVLFEKVAEETGVPELRSHAKIFAATHESIGLAAFGCGWDAVAVEIVLFTAGDGHQPRQVEQSQPSPALRTVAFLPVSGSSLPTMREQRVFPSDSLRGDDCLPSRRQTPATRPKGSVQDPSIFDLGQICYSVRLDLYIVDIYGRQQYLRGVR